MGYSFVLTTIGLLWCLIPNYCAGLDDTNESKVAAFLLIHCWHCVWAGACNTLLLLRPSIFLRVRSFVLSNISNKSFSILRLQKKHYDIAGN
jgi:hypothetical protein